MEQITQTEDRGIELVTLKLDKDKAIVFVGSMNAMPMMYALELKEKGYNVLYFVDVDQSDTLSRPENHFEDIKYPYPDWIIEFKVKSQILAAVFPRIMAKLIQSQVKQHSNSSVQYYVLNGFFVSMTPHMQTDCIGLSHGSDLESWADEEGWEDLSEVYLSKSIFQFLPKSISKPLIKTIVKRQFDGFAASKKFLYFPLGFNKYGDRVVKRLQAQGCEYVPRYDISFKPLKNCSREFKKPEKTLNILSAVRFCYKTFPDGNPESSKGNDKIIKGIADYYQQNPNIHVHFFEKGEDVEDAKLLCKEFGIESVVTWHKQMPFTSLLKLYEDSDICFDQVGDHWLAAIGGYALWLGKPLIANDNRAICSGIWPSETPVLSASSREDVSQQLQQIEDITYRESISKSSKTFVEKHMGPHAALQQVFEY